MRVATLLLCLASLALSACAGPGRYPLSGETCAPDDPVHDIQGCDFMVMQLLPVCG